VVGSESELFVRDRAVVIDDFCQPGMNQFRDYLTYCGQQADWSMILGELRVLPWFGDENDVGSLPASWEVP
jgi:hypothetical protein